MSWSPVFQDRNFSTVFVPSSLVFSVRQVTIAAQGGMERCEITATGNAYDLWALLGWLRYAVEVLDDLGVPIWWGYAHELYLSVGAISLGISLDGMSNSIAIAYVSDNARGTTAWSRDSTSTSEYGTKELLLSGDNLTTAAAESGRCIRPR